MVPKVVVSVALLFVACLRLLDESPEVTLGLDMLDKPLEVSKVLGMDFSAEEGWGTVLISLAGELNSIRGA